MTEGKWAGKVYAPISTFLIKARNESTAPSLVAMSSVKDRRLFFNLFFENKNKIISCQICSQLILLKNFKTHVMRTHSIQPCVFCYGKYRCSFDNKKKKTRPEYIRHSSTCLENLILVNWYHNQPQMIPTTTTPEETTVVMIDADTTIPDTAKQPNDTFFLQRQLRECHLALRDAHRQLFTVQHVLQLFQELYLDSRSFAERLISCTSCPEFQKNLNDKLVHELGEHFVHPSEGVQDFLNFITHGCKQ